MCFKVFLVLFFIKFSSIFATSLIVGNSSTVFLNNLSREWQMRDSSSRTRNLPQPKIKTYYTRRSSNKGDKFLTTCTVEHAENIPMDLFFAIPHENTSVSDFLKVSNVTRVDRFLTLNLTINKSIRSRDKGNYKCYVIDNEGNFNSKEFSITFAASVSGMSIVNSRISVPVGNNAEFLIKYHTPTLPTFQWFNNKKEKISEGENVFEKEKYSVKIVDKVVNLNIKNVTLEDYGNYTLTIKVETVTANLRFELHVYDIAPPDLKVFHDKLKGEVRAICKVHGGPPNMAITWLSCEHCDGAVNAEFHRMVIHQSESQKSEYEKDYEISFPVTKFRFIACQVEFSDGVKRMVGETLVV